MKRKQRAYKASDIDYDKAMRRGGKANQTKVANLAENAVLFYGKGYDIYARSPQTGEEQKIHQ